MASTAPEAATLLEGFELADAPAFDDWLAQARDRLARRWAEYRETRNLTREERDQLCRTEETRADLTETYEFLRALEHRR